MEHLVDTFIKEIQSTNSPYVLKLTKISDGSLEGRTFVEIMSKTGFRFLDLHSELRNRVYQLVLVKRDPIPIAISRRGNSRKVVTGTRCNDQDHHTGQVFNIRSQKWSGPPLNELSLLGVNTQSHREATPIAYGNNRFNQETSTALLYFVPMIGASVRFLTFVDFGEACTHENMKKHFSALQSATGLRELQLDAVRTLSTYGHSNFSECAIVLAKDLRSLLLCLQVSYKVDHRSWKALDVVKIRPSIRQRGEYAEICRKQLGAEQIQWHQLEVARLVLRKPIIQAAADASELGAAVRKQTNLYLKDE